MDSALPFSMDQRPCVDCCCLQRGFIVASAVDMLQRFSPLTSRTSSKAETIISCVNTPSLRRNGCLRTHLSGARQGQSAQAWHSMVCTHHSELPSQPQCHSMTGQEHLLPYYFARQIRYVSFWK